MEWKNKAIFFLTRLYTTINYLVTPLLLMICYHARAYHEIDSSINDEYLMGQVICKKSKIFLPEIWVTCDWNLQFIFIIKKLFWMPPHSISAFLFMWKYSANEIKRLFCYYFALIQWILGSNICEISTAIYYI